VLAGQQGACDRPTVQPPLLQASYPSRQGWRALSARNRLQSFNALLPTRQLEQQSRRLRDLAGCKLQHNADTLL